MAATAHPVGTARVVRELAAELLPRAEDLAREMTDHLRSTIPEYASVEDEELRAEVTASSAANVRQVFRLLADGCGLDQVVVPNEALELTRGLVRRNIPLTAQLRSYRLGHAWLWERWSRALKRRVEDSDELAAAQDQGSAFMFGYVDTICDRLVEEFGSERERLIRSATQLRTETVRAILDGSQLDEEVASRRLGYELGRHHLALQIMSRTDGGAGVERAVREAAAALGSREPLVIPSGAARFDVWCGSFEPVRTDELERYEPPPGVVVAFGRSGEGVSGFRTSHTEALHAARMSSLAGGMTRAMISYARVEVVSLLASDLPRARAFVLAELGPLAAPTASAQRLRETVLAYLVSGGSATRVAKELYVHQNTVAYRVKKAEEMLGRKVLERPIELSCALTLTSVLGSAVLAGEDGVTEFD
jgi:DNA-binding PucR family transcriptional regulator